MEQAIIYVTRDIERALGIEPNPHFHIVTNKTIYTESLQGEYTKYIHKINSNRDPRALKKDSMHGKILFDTGELLESVETGELINALTIENKQNPKILVFKNNKRIEDICRKNGWHLLNPNATLSEKIENKITQVEWLGELQKYLPPHSVVEAKEIKWNNEPLVIQWAHGHTGDGTLVVNSKKEIEIIKEKFPERIARVTSFVKGPTFTVNIVINKQGVYLGNISYQITGIPPFTENVFSTIGNDWSLPGSILTNREIEQIEEMAMNIGKKMAQDGWIGMAGIDVIRDEERNEIYLLEINARQPASTTYESKLQEASRSAGSKGLTIFEAYIKSLNGEKIKESIVKINDGAQIISRVTSINKTLKDDVIGSLQMLGYNVIPYENVDKNDDLLRIQSSRGIMETHGKFNTRGKEIQEYI
jgi:predicted ATP-grasp superfamily ATP-dependent carboligase